MSDTAEKLAFPDIADKIAKLPLTVCAMSFDNQTASIHYACAVVNAARRLGHDPAPMLEEAAINPGLLTKTEMRLTPEQLAKLLQAAWRIEDDEFLGMGIGQCRHGIFTLMARQAIHCGNLRAVYRHLSRFYNLVSSAIRIEFESHEKIASLSMALTAPELDQDHMLVDFLMLIWHRFPSWLIGQRIPLLGIDFAFPKPSHAKEYPLLFPCPARFDQPVNRFYFPADRLSLPVVQTPETLRRHLRRAPLDWFQRQHYYQAYTRRVLDALMPDQDFVNLQIEDIAAMLNITARTLRRKLTEEKTAFQELKNIARRDTAIHLLSQRHLPISQIAHTLGYTETASFSRAFKEWTGTSPQRFKR